MMDLNPRLFAFSSYLGPIVNLTFDDASVLQVAAALPLGSLRYPGGATANSWNLSSGRWVWPEHEPYVNNSQYLPYVRRTDAFPMGTFTPRAYMDGIGAKLAAPPIWNLNLVTLPDPPSQLDALATMGVPVRFVELGNEVADQVPSLQAYLTTARTVTARTRELFPTAQISVIGCFNHEWTSCAARLRQEYRGGNASRLFDAVTVHKYAPTNATIMRAPTDALRRTATLAWILPVLEEIERSERHTTIRPPPSEHDHPTAATLPLPPNHCHPTTATQPMPPNHCHPTTATQPLPPNHCHPTTATQPLPHDHCHPTTATLPLPHDHCHPTTATQSLPPNHCHPTTATLPLPWSAGVETMPSS